MSAQLEYAAPHAAVMGNSPALQSSSVATRDAGAYMNATFGQSSAAYSGSQSQLQAQHSANYDARNTNSSAHPAYDHQRHTNSTNNTNSNSSAYDHRFAGSNAANYNTNSSESHSSRPAYSAHRREASLERPRPTSARDRSIERPYSSAAYALTGNPTDYMLMDREQRKLLTPNPPRFAQSSAYMQQYDPYGTIGHHREFTQRMTRDQRSRSFDEQNLLEGVANPYFGAPPNNNNSLLTTAPPLGAQLSSTVPILPSSVGAQLNQVSQMDAPYNHYGAFNSLGSGLSRNNPEVAFNHLEISALQKECARLYQELEMSREKLTSCMNSIKNFWSPELKKERALRKEDATKYSMLSEHVQLLQAEKQKLVLTMENMEAELQSLRHSRGVPGSSLLGSGGHDSDMYKLQNDKLVKEVKMLKKTVDDLEYKLTTQRQTLGAREENIKRLMDMLQSKGIDVSHVEEDRVEMERLRAQLYEVTKQKRDMESILIERDADTSQSREEIESVVHELQSAKRESESLRKQLANYSTLQSALDTKDSKILTLESEIRLLEDEIARLRDVAIGGTLATSPSSGIGMEDYEKIIQHLRTNERILKNRLEHVAAELSKREADVYAWQTKLETAEKQAQDQQHHIHVLKEQIKAKDQKLSTLGTDLDDLRKRVKEKESAFEKKSKQFQQLQQEKRTVDTELSDTREQMEIREKRIMLLQRKAENLEDLINEKDAQIQASKSRLLAMTADHSSTDSVKQNLEEALRDKERQLERLKELKEQLEKDHLDELNMYKKMNNDLRSKLEALQKELDEKQMQIASITDELQEAKADRLRRDTEKTQLDILVTQRNVEMNELQQEIERQKRSLRFESQQNTTAYEQRIRELEQQLLHLTEVNTKLQCDADRFTIQLKANEQILQERDRQLKDAHDQIGEVREKMSQVRRSQQQASISVGSRKFTSAQADLGSEIEELHLMIREKDERIFELEQAVKEGLRSAAERETHFSDRDGRSRDLERQVQRLESANQELKHRVDTLRLELEDRESKTRQHDSHSVSVSSSSESETLKRENRALVSEVNLLRKTLVETESKLDAAFESQTTDAHLDEMRKLRRQSQEMDRDRLLGNSSAEEVDRLQRNNQELSFRAQQLQRTLEEREERVRQLESDCLSKHLSEIDQLRSRNRDLLSRTLELERQLNDKSNQLLELMRSGASATANGEISVLRQSLKEKDERLAFLEAECFHNQAMEIDRLRAVADEYQAKLANLKRTQEERNDKFINMELESKTLVEELKRTRREREEIESMFLSLRKQLSEKEERVKLLEKDFFEGQAGDLEKLRRELQESQLRISQQKRSGDEKEEQLRRLQFEKERVLDELNALRKRNDELENGFSSNSKRLQERDERLQLIETEFGAEIDRLRTSNQELVNKVGVLRKIADDKDLKLENLDNELQRRLDELRQVMKQRDDAENVCNALRTQMREAEEQLRVLDHECFQVQRAEIDKLKSESQDLTHKLTEVKEFYAAETEKTQAVSSELQRSKEEFKQFRKQYEDLVREAERTKKDFLEVQALMKQMENECEVRHVQELERLQRVAVESNNALVLMKRQLAEDAEQSQLLHTQITELQNQLQVSNRSLKDKDELVKQHTKELERAVSEISFLQRTVHEKDEKYQEQVSEIERLKRTHYDSSTSTKVLRKQLDETLEKQQKLLSDCDLLRRESEATRRALQEKDDRIQILETECFQQQSREIEQLKKANQEFQNKLAVLRNLLQERDERIKQLDIEHTVKHGSDAAAYEKQLQDAGQRIAGLMKKLEEREMRIKQLESAQADLSRQPSRDRINVPQMTGVSRDDLEQLRLQLEMATRDAQVLNKKLQEKDERIQLLENECFQQQTFEIERLRKENDELSEHVQILVQRVDELESEGRSASSNNALQQKNDDIDRLRKQMHDANAIMERLNTELSEKTEKLNILENECSKSHAMDIERMKKQVSEYEKRMQENDQCIQEYERNLQEYAARNQEYEEHFQETEQRVQEYEHQIREYEKCLQESESRYTALQAAFDELQKSPQRASQQPVTQNNKLDDKALQQAHGEIEALRAQLQQAHDEIDAHRDMLQQAAAEIELQRNKQQQAASEVEAMRVRLEAESRNKAPQPQAQSQSHAAEVEALRSRLAEGEKMLNDVNKRLTEANRQLEESKAIIVQLEQDNRRLLCDYYDMKHEALVASLCEKDANIAVMQLAGPPNAQLQKQLQQIQNEKAKLQEQLKEVAQVKSQIQAQLHASKQG